MADKWKGWAGMRAAHWAVLLAASLAANGSVAQTSAEPPLVTAYLKQLAQACGDGGTSGRSEPDRVDLNGDGVDDWVVDASRRPCAKPAATLSRQGDLLTVFVTLKDGRTVPAFQATTHGSRLERVSGLTSLWVTVSGPACGGPDETTRCDRRLAWRPEAFRFVLEAAAPKAAR